jgi:hypothetical protein
MLITNRFIQNNDSYKTETKRFNDSVILHELKQPQAKFILMALSQLFEKFDAGISHDEFKSLLAHAKSRNNLSFSNDTTQNLEKFKNCILETYDSILDAYVNKQSEFIDDFVNDVNKLLSKRDDPDLFNLSEGDTIKIEAGRSVYG